MYYMSEGKRRSNFGRLIPGRSNSYAMEFNNSFVLVTFLFLMRVECFSGLLSAYQWFDMNQRQAIQTSLPLRIQLLYPTVLVI